MSRWLYWIAILTLTAGHPVVALAEIAAELDRSEVSIDDAFNLTLIVKGSQIEMPDGPPEVDGLVLAGRNVANSNVISNGQVISEYNIVWTFRAQKTGMFEIPSIRARVDGREEATLPLKIKVTDAGTAQTAPGTPGGQQPQTLPKGKAQPKDTAGLFIERECSKNAPWVGEQIICTIRLYHRSRINGGQKVNTPSPDFRRFPVEGEKRYRRVVQGQPYDVIEMREVVVAEKPGEQELPSYGIDARVLVYNRKNNPFDKFFDQFGGGGMFNFDMSFAEEREVRVESQPTLLQVKPLPESGKPDGYDGLVGNFQLSASVSKSTLKTGETVTITIKIAGKGFLDRLAYPTDPFKSVGKIYPDKPEYKEVVDWEQGLNAEKVFKFAIVPVKAGRYALGEVNIPVFNDRLGDYVILHHDLGELIVEPGEAEKQQPLSGKTEANVLPLKTVETLGEDIIGLHRNIDLGTSHTITKKMLVILLSSSIAPYALLGFLFFYTHKDRYFTKSGTPFSIATKSFTVIIGQLGTASPPTAEQLTSAFRAFKECCGAAAGRKGAALTSPELQTLVTAMVPDAEGAALSSACDWFERLEFAGMQPAGTEWQKQVDVLKDLVRRLQNGRI